MGEEMGVDSIGGGEVSGRVEAGRGVARGALDLLRGTMEPLAEIAGVACRNAAELAEMSDERDELTGQAVFGRGDRLEAIQRGQSR